MSGRNKAKPKHRTRGVREKTGAIAETKMTSVISDLVEFEDFKEKILPAIKKDLMRGMTSKELREKYSALVQARQLTTAIASRDEGRASAAAKDIIDRTEGKATEHREVTHKYADLPDEELDAIIRSEEEELEFLESNSTEH